jgi:hypothetical protein
MGNRAALLAVIIVGACGGGGSKKSTTKPTEPTPGSGSAAAKPVDPVKPKPQPVDIATLEAWTGNVDDGPVKVVAADVDGEVLRRVLVPPAIEIISARSEALVTGRVAGSRVGAVAALTGKEPALKLGPRIKLAGKPQVSFDFVGADSRDLFRILADVMATNIVSMAPPAKLTVSAKDAGAAKLLDAIVKTAGLVTEKAAANVMVVRAASQPKVGKLPAKGAKLDLVVYGARAGDVLALINAVTGAPPAKGDCSAGAGIEVRLRAVASGAATKLVEKLAGDAKATPCALAPIGDAAPPNLTPVAFASSGTKRFAVAMDGDNAFLIDDAMPNWDVTATAVMWTGGSPKVTLEPVVVGPGPGPLELDDVVNARLAATVTGLDGGDIAIIEVDGLFRAVTKDQYGVQRIGVGELEVKDDDGATHVLKLEKRPAAK